MKKFNLLFILAILTAFSFQAKAECPALAFPKNFTMTEYLLSVSVKFDLNEPNNSTPFAKLEGHFFTLTTKFSLVNAKNEVVARAKSRLLTWGTHIDIEDCEGKKLGEIKIGFLTAAAQAVALNANFYNEYFIYNDKRELIGKSTKLSLVGTGFTIYAANKEKVAKLSKPWLNIRDKWTMDFEEANTIDPRIIIMLSAWKTKSDWNAGLL